jgi:hypothetical protein
MDVTDAEAVRSEVTGEPGKQTALPKVQEDPLLRMSSIKKGPASKDTSASNIVLISLIFFLFFGAVCAALYFFEFFGSWNEESIDYDLITNLPDENIESFTYITAKEDAFKEASSAAGELLGGGLLKEIKKANIAFVQYGGGVSGYAVYLESGQSIPWFAENLGNYLYPSISFSQNKLGIEKKNALGIDYYLIKIPGGDSSQICAWQQGKGIVLLYYNGAKNDDCSSRIGKKSSKKRYEEMLKPAESIRRDLKTDDLPYAQGWFWQKASDPLDSLQTGEKSAYGQMYSDKDGIYFFGAGFEASEKTGQISGLCDGAIIKTSGKETCYTESTGADIPLMPISSAVLYERGIGKYTIYAFAYPKKQDKNTVKKKAEKFIFSAAFSGTEKTWTDHTTPGKKELPASKTRCGNALCESGENCGNCPSDCKCYRGECVNGACRTLPYSIELPSLKNRSWNITYTPLGEKIKVQSDNCFYLDVLYSSGEEIEPYDADVKNCVSAHRVKYNTTGPGAAPWFNWGGCAGLKYFQVTPGTDLVLRVYTEACPGCSCYHPQFNVYDWVGGDWVKFLNKTTE